MARFINHEADSRDRRIFELLTDVSQDVQKVANVQMTSAIVIKHEIISIGSAIKKSHPLQARFSKNPESIFLHSEINALRKALKIVSVTDLEKASIYICRIRQHGNGVKNTYGWGLACPCSGCMAALTEFGIKKIYHTINSVHLEWDTIP